MRLKIIAGNLAAVVMLGLASYWLVRSEVEQRIIADMDAAIGQDQLQLERSLRLSGMEFMNAVRDRAETSQLITVFSALDETGRRNRAYEAAEAITRWFQDPARGLPASPEIVVITDETGRVIARNADRNQMYGVALDQQFPAVREVLRTWSPRVDVWNRKDDARLLRTAVAPVVTANDRRLLGALVVSYDLSDGVASAEAKAIGNDVAFIGQDRVYSSSIPQNASAALKGFLFEGEVKSQTEAALAGRIRSSNIWMNRLGDDHYQGAIAPLPHATSVPMAVVVLGNQSKALGTASATNIILILTLLFALVVIGYGIAVGSLLLRPIEQIEEGVLAVINGNSDLRLNVTSPELGGLAYRINQLLNLFTGVPEEASSDSTGQTGISRPPEPAAWKDAAFSDGSGSVRGAQLGGPAGNDESALAARLAAENEGSYYRRVYQEYVKAKRATGEDVSQIPQEHFVKRLQANEAALVKQHGARMVRFVVQSRDGQVNLHPVIIP